jgi:GT2 family glycosyltransferase
MSQEINVSIITITYNGLAETCQLLDTIPLQTPGLEVIVVDNASIIDEASAISQRYPSVRTIRNSENNGFAGGNNIGIEAAHGKYLYFINNDTEFHPFDISSPYSALGVQSHDRRCLSENQIYLGFKAHTICGLYPTQSHHFA